MNEIFVAIDIGGSKTAFAAVSFPEARLVERDEIPTPPRDATGAGFLADIAARARALATQHGARAIGVSVCELVSRDGKPTSSHRLAWDGLDPTAAFAGGPPLLIESDVRAGALAEARFGAGEGMHELLYVNLGTGVSSCWVSGGEPHRGARGNALVLANSPAGMRCVHCDRQTSQVPEDVAGAAGLLSRYRAAGGQASSAQAVFAAAAAGDAAASDVLEQAVHALGQAIGHAIDIIDPDALVIGGGLALAGGAYGAPLEAAIRAHVWAPDTRALPILRARLGADSALIGAAAAARDALPRK